MALAEAAEQRDPRRPAVAERAAQAVDLLGGGLHDPPADGSPSSAWRITSGAKVA